MGREGWSWESNERAGEARCPVTSAQFESCCCGICSKPAGYYYVSPNLWKPFFLFLFLSYFFLFGPCSASRSSSSSSSSLNYRSGCQLPYRPATLSWILVNWFTMLSRASVRSAQVGGIVALVVVHLPQSCPVAKGQVVVRKGWRDTMDRAIGSPRRRTGNTDTQL